MRFCLTIYLTTFARPNSTCTSLSVWHCHFRCTNSFCRPSLALSCCAKSACNHLTLCLMSPQLLTSCFILHVTLCFVFFRRNSKCPDLLLLFITCAKTHLCHLRDTIDLELSGNLVPHSNSNCLCDFIFFLSFRVASDRFWPGTGRPYRNARDR